MVYNEFLETMKKQMELALGDGYSLTLRKVQKNNGIVAGNSRQNGGQTGNISRGIKKGSG